MLENSNVVKEGNDMMRSKMEQAKTPTEAKSKAQVDKGVLRNRKIEGMIASLIARITKRRVFKGISAFGAESFGYLLQCPLQ